MQERTHSSACLMSECNSFHACPLQLIMGIFYTINVQFGLNQKVEKKSRNKSLNLEHCTFKDSNNWAGDVA